MEEDNKVSRATTTSSASFNPQAADPMGSEEEEAVYSPTQGSVFSNSPVNSIEEESNSLNHSPYSPDYVPSPLKRPISPEQDRISALPDAIIHHILSFLPTNDSIKTNVLSKRWVNLWSFVPNLSFRVLDSQPDKLFRIINGTLNSYSSTQIKKFFLRFNYCLLTDKIPKSNLDSYIDLWLRFATEQNAEELCLKFCSKRVQLGKEKRCDRYRMPKFIFDDSSLTKLRSRCCDYMPKREVSWACLKVLSIANAVLTNNILQRILLGSPILEELELHYCLILTSLNVISSGSLKRLVIEDFYNPQKTVEEFKYSVIEISAPNLKSLGILRRWTGTRCHLLNVSSLIDAHIDFVLYYDCTVSNKEFMESMYEIFQKIKHVEQLTIGAGCIQALSVVEDLGLPSPLLNCICNWKCLILHMRGISRFGLIGMASLLQTSPNVEKLVLDDMTRCESFAKYIPIHPTGENFWTLGERSFSCLLRQLKTIELDAYSWLKFQGLQDEIVEFLLQNAMVLEKMVVCSWHLYMSSYDCYEEARNLLSFPRASPHAVILLPKLLD